MLLTVDPNHVFQNEDPLCQDLQGLSKLLHTLTLVRMKSQVQGLSQAGVRTGTEAMQTQWTSLTALPLRQCPHHYRQPSEPTTGCVPGWCSQQDSPTSSSKPSQPASP